ncbi:MAG TPA: hypothetical protein VGN97_23195 [Mesorhizobium sp.]|jgi:hypothetical protein|nr:hypothetical protein [Mesorhizobium sp.]
MRAFSGRGRLAAAFLFAATSAASAQTSCGLCDTEVVTNSALASCFLERYEELDQKEGAAVAVDLSNCPPPAEASDRGVVEALPGPGFGTAEEPDLKFLVSPVQLDCLKAKLEEPGLVLDPQARIDLGACG